MMSSTQNQCSTESNINADQPSTAPVPTTSSKPSAKLFQCRYCHHCYTSTSNRSKHVRRHHPAEYLASIENRKIRVGGPSSVSGANVNNTPASQALGVGPGSVPVLNSSNSLGNANNHEEGEAAAADSGPANELQPSHGFECLLIDDIEETSSESEEQSSGQRHSQAEHHDGIRAQDAIAEESDDLDSENENYQSTAAKRLGNSTCVAEKPQNPATTSSQPNSESPRASSINTRLAKLVPSRDKPSAICESTAKIDLTVAQPFLRWLSEFPVTETERLVKVKRVTTEAQLAPIRTNLRLIFSILVQNGVCTAERISLAVLGQQSVCTLLHEVMCKRNAGPCRIHCIFLLVKKVVVYLSAQESLRLKQWTPPSTIESYSFVCSLCSEATTQRKAHAADRALIGTHPVGSPSSFYASSGTQSPVLSLSSSREPQTSGLSLAGDKHFPAAVPMTKVELQSVLTGCMRYLSAATSDGRSATSVKEALRYTAYLITAFLCLGFAPRSQVLAQLQLGTSLTRDSPTSPYWIRLRSEQSKNGKPVLLPVPDRLTSFFSHYITITRAAIIRLASAPAGADKNYLFLRKTGEGPRLTGFSDMTRYVTRMLINREVTCHAFRSTIITVFYQSGASQADMTNLARLMSHDPQTARNYYFRPLYQQTIQEASSRLQTIVEDAAIVNESPPSTAVSQPPPPGPAEEQLSCCQ